MPSLLPPNATELERSATAVAGVISELPVPLRTLIDPDTIPVHLLPWLAWHLGIETWKDYWPEQVKRARVRSAISIARKKGTAAAVREVVASFGANIALREWWQMEPKGRPYTFDLVMTVSARDGNPPTAEFIGDIVAEIDRTKPVRAHYTFTQGFNQVGGIGVAAAIRPALFTRLSLSDV
ncbi:phage tail protein I [Ralstonia sp. CHL-2022]|uniref:Phage tail protein I n=1 Tax=Ralstonia mojiangensis TaxID=2953895 RepID=A0ABT2L4S2_9RALS|nr:phage tail protein I [Ralstonia mojiangensis]MCT7309693.1 phage tail protein I [Ralstonia mojiangensis]